MSEREKRPGFSSSRLKGLYCPGCPDPAQTHVSSKATPAIMAQPSPCTVPHRVLDVATIVHSVLRLCHSRNSQLAAWISAVKTFINCLASTALALHCCTTVRFFSPLAIRPPASAADAPPCDLPLCLSAQPFSREIPPLAFYSFFLLHSRKLFVFSTHRSPALENKLATYCGYRINRLSMSNLLEFGAMLNREDALRRSCSFIHTEGPIRLAHMIQVSGGT